ncbi:MAG: PKD domain-containing protein, partial [Flavobacteriales bacterium]
GGNPTAVGSNNTSPVTYSWNNAGSLNNNNTANPTATPNQTTNYTVQLSGGGCDNEEDHVIVTVLPSPNASFTFGPNNACAGTTVNFLNNTTSCPGCTYAWDFDNPSSGSSNTSTSANPSHVFVSTGNNNVTFDVVLTVTSSNGCTDTYTQAITVQSQPDAILNEDANYTQCLGLNQFYAYVNNASTPSNNSNYTINWGDGTSNYSSNTPPSNLEHIYNGIDIWTLTYTVTGTNGCTDVATYLVTNISNPALGATTSGNTLQCGPVELCFTISGVASNFSEITYDVNFGDGTGVQTFTQSNLPNPVCHTYNSSSCPGAYTFTITANSNCPVPTQATITPIQIFTPPIAQFTNPPNYCVNTSAPFTNTTIPGYNQSCNSNSSYSWNFGDPASGANNTSTAANPSHVFSQPGTYTVTLTATNSGNPQLSCGSTTFTNTICIEPAPAPAFTVNQNLGCVPMTVTTNNTSSSPNACSTVTSWLVDYVDLPCDPDNGSYSFAGGTSASSINPQFTLSSVGTYTLRLRMTNSCGTFEDNEVVTVNTVPVVNVTTPAAGVCVGGSGTPSAVVDNCNLAVTYLWTFTNGTPSSATTQTAPAVTYNTVGSQNVTLAVTNSCGTTSDSDVMNVQPAPNVVISSSIVDLGICSGSTATLSATGANAYSWSPSTFISSGGGT